MTFYACVTLDLELDEGWGSNPETGEPESLAHARARIAAASEDQPFTLDLGPSTSDLKTTPTSS